jgi:hypothetical protein
MAAKPKPFDAQRKSFKTTNWDPWTYPVNYVSVITTKQKSPAKSPGIATIVDAADERNIDELKGFGISKPFSRFLGRKLARFSIKLQLYGPADYQAWNIFRGIISILPTQKIPNAMDIWHPQLEEIGVRAFQLLKLPQAVQEQDGIWSVDIKCIEFAGAPKVAVIKPTASAGKPTDPNADVKAQLASARQADQLATKRFK